MDFFGIHVEEHEAMLDLSWLKDISPFTMDCCAHKIQLWCDDVDVYLKAEGSPAPYHIHRYSSHLSYHVTTVPRLCCPLSLSL